MAGRHSKAVAARKRKALWLYTGAFIVAALVAVFAVRVVSDVASSCGETVEFTVDADPSIAPALTELVESDLPESDDESSCLRPEIRATESSATAKLLTTPGGTAALDRPDMWIPDSSIWLDRVRAENPALPAGRSVASSPVVLATTEKVASEADWPSRNPSWSELLGGVGVAGTPKPVDDASAVFALMGIDQLKWSPIERTQAIQALTKHTFAASDKPYDHLPDGKSKPTVATFPSSEQAVLQRNNAVDAGGTKSVVAAYPETVTPWLDYPAVVLDGIPSAKRAVAERFQQVLGGPLAAAALAEHGFRDPDGVLAGAGAADKRVHGEAGERVPPPDTKTVTTVLQRWATFSASARMIVAVDVSASMKAKVPGVPFNRMQVALATIAEALRLLRPDTEVALWKFSTAQDGKKPYKELATYKPMKEHIAEGLPDRVPELMGKPTGFTGLFDTTLAAVKESQENWDPGRLNLVLMVTDGKNQFPDGLTKPELLEQLGSVMDEDRPTAVIFVGLGTEVDSKELNDIAKATGGQVHLSPDVKKAKDLFYTILRNLASPPK